MNEHETTIVEVTPARGKVITDVKIHEEHTLMIRFDDGSLLELEDDLQMCCEYRWMSTDDALGYFTGSVFLGAHVSGEDYDENHDADTEFLIVSTSLGEFTVVNYNQHNGYYGGFDIRARYTPGHSKA